MARPAIRPSRTTFADGRARALSSVTAVSLLLLLTLALSVFLASFAIGLGQISEADPQRASLSVSVDERTDNITVTHQGGDGLADTQTRIVVRNASNGDRMTFQPGSSGGVLTAGDSIVIDVDGGVVDSGSSGFTARPAATPMAGLHPGTGYTIRVIDTRSERIVFETAVVV